MEDSFSKLVTIIISVIMLCVIPSFYLSVLCDFNNYYYENNYIKSKLDEAIYKGKIDDLDLVSNNDITIYRDTYVPIYDEEKTISFTNDTIKREIENNDVFYLEKGDSIVITHKNNFTNTNVFMNKLFNTDNETNYITYAGVVKNESF